MKPIFVVFISISFTFSGGENCDKYGVLIYEDFACTPKYDSDKKCPFKYDCENLGPSEQYCYFKGKAYQNRENVDNALSSPSCHVACHCRLDDGRSRFNCAVLDCPEWLGETLQKNCYRQYSLDSCCSTGQICPPFDEETCNFEDHEYKEGQHFYPSDSCYSCVCKKGFKGELEEPFCRRTSCGEQLGFRGRKVQEACAPFYSKNRSVLCCPEDWICSEGNEEIKGDPKSDDECKYGNTTLKVGQYIEKTNVESNLGIEFKEVKCECVIPPFAQCRDV